jgi:HEAT repeat protein
VTGSQNCPSCGKALDPMHAPVARIRGGKVVSFCSAECAAGLVPGTGLPAPAAEPVRRPSAGIEAAREPRRSSAAMEAAREPERRPSAAMEAAREPSRSAGMEAAREPRRSGAMEAAREPVRAPRMPSSREYLAADADDSDVRALRRSRRGRGAILTVCVLVLAAGIGLLVTEVLPAATAPEPAAPAAEPAARRPPLTARVDAAVAELRSLIASSSPRVRRLAAQALARTGDADSLALLRRLKEEEPSQLGRIQIAYALARAGDTPARDDLRILLAAERRDARLDAARSLVQLGDDSGRKALRAMLSVEQHRIGAAGLLARLGDEDGLAALRAEAADKRATPEARMRAQVALGRAGDRSVEPALQKILADKRYNVGAADALAALGNPAAGPALTVQLGLSAMRVQAALWLRRMKVEVDLAPLDLALRAADEASRVSAAEALLILAGPPSLAERD